MSAEEAGLEGEAEDPLHAEHSGVVDERLQDGVSNPVTGVSGGGREGPHFGQVDVYKRQEYEWAAHGLAPYMKVIAGQEMGSKAEHVEYAAKGKYADDKILLIGDAPGDRDAAAKVGCLYYPILPGDEAGSWRRFTAEALPKFLDGSFAGDYQRRLIDEFNATVPGEVPWETRSGVTTITMPQGK